MHMTKHVFISVGPIMLRGRGTDSDGGPINFCMKRTSPDYAYLGRDLLYTIRLGQIWLLFDRY